MKNTKYTAIVNNIRREIKNGKYPPGSKLPGKKALALNYNVSEITSERALQELEKMTIVERRKRSGTYVLDFPRMLKHISLVFAYGKDDRSSISDYFKAILLKAQKYGIPSRIFYYYTDPLLTEIINNPVEGGGVLLVGFEDKELILKLEAASIPCVVVGLQAKYSNFYVSVNRKNAVRELTSNILESSNCKRPVFIGNINHSNHLEASYGFSEALNMEGFKKYQIYDCDEKNIFQKLTELFKEKLAPDALIIMGGNMPIAALPAILIRKKMPKLGFLSEEAVILQLKEIAYIASYSHFEIGQTAFDLVNDIASGKVQSPTAKYVKFELSSPPYGA